MNITRAKEEINKSNFDEIYKFQLIKILEAFSEDVPAEENRIMIITPKEALEITGILGNCCQLMDGKVSEGALMTDWDKEQRLALGQISEKFYQFWNKNKGK